MRGLMLRTVWPAIQAQCRTFSSQTPGGGVDKALLSKLRKQTGIPFINCKKALAKFDNDFDQAKKWLQEEAQKEGWARATKLQSRPMSQGLVALIGDNKKATMLEVNCETDFVAKNEKFVDMVTKLLQECDGHFEKQSENKISMNKSELGKLVSSEGSTLADTVALGVGNLGENMALRRGVFVRVTGDSVLSYYVHPSSTKKSAKKLLLGKYGAMVEMRSTKPQDPAVMSLSDLGSHLCQHIVGMNPRIIGEYTPPPAVTDESEELVVKGEPQTSEEGRGAEEDGADGALVGEGADEDSLLQQEFLLDTTMTVGELLCMNNVEVLDFRRFACGEEVEGEKEE